MDDATAIARSRAGDRDAFRHLVERYQREAYAHALAITGDRDLASDAVQDALIDAWRGLPRFERGRDFYPWLYTLVRHRCLKGLARRGPTAPEGELPRLLEPTSEARETSGDLERALWRLAPEDRELIVLKHLDGLGYAELATRLCVRPGTVMSRLHHARQRLKALLEPSPPEGATNARSNL